MRGICGALRTYQPHYPPNRAEVRFEIFVLFKVEILDHLECESFRLQDICLRLKIDIYGKRVGSPTRRSAHQAIQAQAVGRRLLQLNDAVAVYLRVIKTQAHTDSKKTTDAVKTIARFLRWKILRRSRSVGSLSGKVFNWSPLPRLKCVFVPRCHCYSTRPARSRTWLQ